MNTSRKSNGQIKSTKANSKAKAAKQPKGHETVRLSSFEAKDGAVVNVIEFGLPGDRYAFSFGIGKAKKLLAAIDEIGHTGVQRLLEQLVDSSS